MSIPLSLRYRLRQYLIPRSPFFIPPLHHVPGLSLYRDLEEADISPRVVFDVGANIGQSSYAYQTWWPDAHVVAFEPLSTNYNVLKSNLKDSAVTCVHAACSNRNGEASIHIHEKGVAASLEHEGVGRQETINCVTLDHFTSKHSIQQIDFLKVDVEGHELSVLEGASQLLSQHRITSLLVEVGFQTSVHVPFSVIRDTLKKVGFVLYALHDQGLDRRGRQLKWANALFIHN